MRYWKLICCPFDDPTEKVEYVNIAPAELDEMAAKESVLMKAEEFTGRPMRCLEIREETKRRRFLPQSGEEV